MIILYKYIKYIIKKFKCFNSDIKLCIRCKYYNKIHKCIQCNKQVFCNDCYYRKDLKSCPSCDLEYTKWVDNIKLLDSY